MTNFFKESYKKLKDIGRYYPTQDDKKLLWEINDALVYLLDDTKDSEGKKLWFRFNQKFACELVKTFSMAFFIYEMHEGGRVYRAYRANFTKENSFEYSGKRRANQWYDNRSDVKFDGKPGDNFENSLMKKRFLNLKEVFDKFFRPVLDSGESLGDDSRGWYLLNSLKSSRKGDPRLFDTTHMKFERHETIAVEDSLSSGSNSALFGSIQ